MATIALATEYDPTKFTSGMFVSQKLDGVPIKLWIDNERGTPHHCTRQNTQLKSIDHVLDAAASILPRDVEFVGELYIPKTSFKDISGQVRANAPAPDLQLFIYDVIMRIPYNRRKNVWEQFTQLGHRTIRSVYDMPNGLEQHHCDDIEDADTAIAWAESTWKDGMGVEGLVFRNPNLLPTQAGKRCKGFQRYKPKPTIDLRIVGFEEAVSEAGVPLGMVGRINVLYNGETIGVGAGRLSHADRRIIFANPAAYVGRIIEVQYMLDPTYKALRQPTFQRFRPDKDAPDA